MRAQTGEGKNAMASRALQDLAADYVRRYGLVVKALKGGGGSSAAEFLRDQVGASSRLRAQLATLTAAIESAQLEIDLRQRQASRLEDFLEARNQELGRLRRLLERQRAWADEHQGVAALLVESPTPTVEPTEAAPPSQPVQLPSAEGGDAALSTLQHRRDLLRDWVRIKSGHPDGLAKLRTQLRDLYRRYDKLEAAYEEVRTDADYAEAQRNIDVLGPDAGAGEADQVVARIAAETAELGRRREALHGELAVVEEQLRTAQADQHGRGAAAAWLEGELAGRRIWASLGVVDSDDESTTPTISEEARRLSQLMHEMRQSDALTRAAQSELHGRQDQLRWIHGELEAQKRWSTLVTKFEGAGVQ